MKESRPGTRVPLRLRLWWLDHPKLAPAKSPHAPWPTWTDIPIEELGYVLTDQEDTRGTD